MDFVEIARINAEPTPTSVGAFLVQYLESHGPSRRSDLMVAVESAWKEAAGNPMKASVAGRVKKALQQLETQGIVRPTGAYGIWELTEEIAQPRQDPEKIVEEATEEGTQTAEDEEQETAAEAELGTGRQIVYAFYLDVYRQLAESRAERRWPIKIGMTTGSLELRMSTHQTALPDAPKIAVIFKVENAALLEKVLHGILTLRGQRHDETGGSEWFITNTQELISLYEWIHDFDDKS